MSFLPSSFGAFSFGKVTPLIDGSLAFSEMFKKLITSKHYVLLGAWYIQLDTLIVIGKKTYKVTDILRNLANQGVKIRILLNYMECKHIKTNGKPMQVGFCSAIRTDKLKKGLESLDKIHNNIKVTIAYHPHSINFFGEKIVLGAFHEKFMVIDGLYAFCGGLELVKDYTHADPSHSRSRRHDVHSSIEGPVVKVIQAHFMEIWNEINKHNVSNLISDDFFKQTEGNLTVQGKDFQKEFPHRIEVKLTRPDYKTSNYKYSIKSIYDWYLEVIRKATKYIYIENQYLRDDSFVAELINQVRNKPKLQVIIVLPAKAEEEPDMFTLHAEFVQFTLIKKLKSQKSIGVYSLRSPTGGFIYVHSKVMIIDDEWLTIGSANANPRSFYLDNELNIAIQDKDLAKQMRLDLWKEHLQMYSEQFELSHSENFVGFWNKQIEVNGKNRKLRIVNHNPAKGEELDPQKLKRELAKTNPLLRFLPLPDPNLYI